MAPTQGGGAILMQLILSLIKFSSVSESAKLARLASSDLCEGLKFRFNGGTSGKPGPLFTSMSGKVRACSILASMSNEDEMA